MKTIIAGTRTITDMTLLDQTIADSGYEITEVGCGCAEGVDKMGGHCYDETLEIWIPSGQCQGTDVPGTHSWACRHDIPVRHFPADWNKHGKKAGPIRNGHMAEWGEALVCLWDGESRGTASMIRLAKDAGIVKVIVGWPR